MPFSVQRLYHAHEDIWLAVVGEDRREMPCQREGGNLSDPQIALAVNLWDSRLGRQGSSGTWKDVHRLEIMVERHRSLVVSRNTLASFVPRPNRPGDETNKNFLHSKFRGVFFASEAYACEICKFLIMRKFPAIRYKLSTYYKPTPLFRADVRKIAHGLIVCTIWYYHRVV